MRLYVTNKSNVKTVDVSYLCVTVFTGQKTTRGKIIHIPLVFINYKN
jgi:hypothetical protein